ncbi:RteC domain-containing protein [Winogradskyella wichelsiae]|uniref:RteC domain-containing protein n=1 Tax=Winogradskyella wichelsiae TaxID=2697007 RepID=UPI0015C6D059|nr:RteC domain-containing protein [Winogradskyella wichelsiae]
MLHITPIVEQYKNQLEQNKNQNLQDINVLTQELELSINTLNQLRVLLRTKECLFNQEAEIYFFKVIKPFVNGRIKYFSKIRQFIFERPNAGIKKQAKYVCLLIDELEKQKIRNLEFFHYIKHNSSSLDHIYFVRGDCKLNFPVDTSHYFSDPEFSTSHDNLAAQVVCYDLLSVYYQKELHALTNQNINMKREEHNPLMSCDLSWTASKTDLVELMYALHSAGSIRNGQVEISKMVEVCAELFDLNLNNVYKTYAEIKNREKDTTKFLDQLKMSLEKRIDLDNAK